MQKLSAVKTPPGKTPLRTMRVPDEQWERWRKVAASKGVSISEWLRALANQAAK